MASVSEVVSTAGKGVGTYFNLISAVPSSVFVLSVYALVASGAPGDRPDLGRVTESFAGADLKWAAAVVVLTLLLGFALHPLQYATVQLMEGYWGIGRLAVRARSLMIEAQQEKLRSLKQQFELASDRVASNGVTGPDRTRALVQRDESNRLIARFPREMAEVMPTRLGNILRARESEAGRAYGLDSTSMLPHLALIAEPAHLDYLNDQRSVLDMTVKLSVLCFLASAVYALALWPYGLWLLVSLTWYLGGYLFYRGAVNSAQHYGIAIAVLIDLNRFALYERLHLPLPDGAADERLANQDLSRLLLGDESVTVAYRHPS